ncbi:MAG: cupin 2 conserved barrel protein [Candidatus Eremiobacteraeota bacterium]|nr:cupin 2 conserved barrel protein [Candidatus Eremiobacteraeota bacterium]
MESLRKISLREKFDAFDEQWSPKIIARVGDFALKVVKIGGEFVWHHHDTDDEIFFVIRGEIAMHYLRDGVEEVERFGAGELLRVPHGVEHKPVAEPGTEIVLFERDDVVNTGNVHDDRLTAQQASI